MSLSSCVCCCFLISLDIDPDFDFQDLSGNVSTRWTGVGGGLIGRLPPADT